MPMLTTTIEELERRLNTAATSTERIDTLNALAWATLRSDKARSLKLCEEALQISKEDSSAPYQKGIAESQRSLAFHRLYAAEYDQSITLAFEALTLADEIGFKELRPSILNSIASCYHLLGDLTQSLEYFMQQERACEEVSDRLEAAKALLGIGVVYFDQDDYANLRQYSERSLAIFEEFDQPYWIGLALNNLFFAQFKLGLYNDALKHANQALELCRRTNDARGLTFVLTSLAEGYLMMGGYADQALACLREALEHAKIVNDPDQEIQIYLQIGQVYLQNGEHSKALDPLHLAVTLAEKHKLRRSLYEAHSHLAQAYKHLGDYAMALSHYESFHTLKEATFSEENAKKIQNLEVLHHTQSAQKEANYFARLYQQTQEFNAQLESEVQKRTEDLRTAYDQLERLDRAKSDFIAVTAHELRTPLTVLTGYGQLLRGDTEIQHNQHRKDLLEGIITGARRLGDVIDAMLLMVKIDSRALEINPEPIEVDKILQKIAKELGEAIKERRQTLEIEPTISRLPTFEGDKTVLAIVFSKIIENAVKYTPDGGRIRIYGHTWRQPPRPGLPTNALEVVVSDTGIGIDPQAQELIFTKFYQTGETLRHSSSKTKFKGGGAGLGLAIARGIIEAHQGKLWVESEGYDEQRLPGSHFHIVIPLKQRPPE